MLKSNGIVRIAKMEMSEFPASGDKPARKKLSFTVASERSYRTPKGEKITDFFQAAAWNGLAETIQKYCEVGDKIFLRECELRSSGTIEKTKDITCPKCSTGLEVSFPATYIELLVTEVEFLDNRYRHLKPAEKPEVRVKNDVATVSDVATPDTEILDEVEAPF